MRLILYLLVALIASTLFALGLLMMKSRAHRLPLAQGKGTLPAIVTWIRDPIWTTGLIVQTAGYAMFVVSLAEAPISMVSVMMQGGIAVFVLFAVVFLGERAVPYEWAGITITILGMLMLALSLAGHEALGFIDNQAMALSSGVLLAIAYLALRVPRFKENGIGAAIFSGVIFGLATIYTKAMADDYTARSTIGLMIRIVTNRYVYLVIITNMIGMVALQNAFSAARGIIAMPLSSALSNIVPIAGGVIVFGEHLPDDTTRATTRIAAFVLTILGSAMLANAREEVAAQVINSSAVADRRCI